MTFIQHEDFISNLRYNIHAAKLHFFCVWLLKSSNRIAIGAHLRITSVAKVAPIVVRNNHSYSNQNSYHQAPWSMDTQKCILYSLHFCNLGGSLSNTAGSLLPYRYSIRRSVQNYKYKRKLDSIVSFNLIKQRGCICSIQYFQLRYLP